MRKITMGLLIAPLSLNCASHNLNTFSTQPLDALLSQTVPGYAFQKTQGTIPANQIVAMLTKQAPNLNPAVSEKVAATLQCAEKLHLAHSNMLAIIDYSRPSNEKRLWVFDMRARTLLYQTYVSHGIKSGSLQTDFFSNVNNSKASSLGVFKTEKPYYGRDGLSLRLEGLDVGFNNNAYNRYIVMHGGWYVNEDFIKKYGRAGRSWGCPAVPVSMTKSIIDSIKNNALLVVYGNPPIFN